MRHVVSLFPSGLWSGVLARVAALRVTVHRHSSHVAGPRVTRVTVNKACSVPRPKLLPLHNEDCKVVIRCRKKCVQVLNTQCHYYYYYYYSQIFTGSGLLSDEFLVSPRMANV